MSKVPGDERTSGQQPGLRGVSAATTRKRVKAKEEPATLVAEDNTRCLVTEDRFRDTSVGDYVVCSWTS